jgi:GNAT superfamily N-acetyltransferase
MRAFTIAISEPDSKTFGFICVRANHVTRAHIPEILEFSRQHQARVLITRSDTSDHATTHALEDAGYRLADTLVYSKAEHKGRTLPERRLALPIRPFRPSDSAQIVEVGRVLFANYFGHYHADPMFDRAKVLEAYVDWVRRSCANRAVAEEIFVADHQGRIAGFVTMRLNDSQESEMVVGGVHPDYRGKSLYRDFLITGIEWSIKKGCARLVYSTQINNYTVQRAWVDVGLQPYQSFYTFHKWF